jgi:hypothetical protein
MSSLYWEGTYGYGDAVGAITHALRNDFDELVYMWYDDRKYYPPTQKYHTDDAETILERVEYINKQFVGEVNIRHDYLKGNGDPVNRVRFVNRRNAEDWKETVWKTKEQPEDHGYICAWTSTNHKDNLKESFLTSYKDPVPSEMIVAMLEKVDREVRYIDYRMPISEVFDSIRNSSYCVGYEGIGQVIAKNYWKPMITFSRGIVSQTTSGPWAYITERIPDSFSDINYTVETIIEIQKEVIDDHRQSCY